MTIFVKRPNDAEEKQKIFSFLYEIWANELHRNTPEMDHRARIMQDNLDIWAKHFLAADETGKIVGCLRNNHFSDGLPSEDIYQHLHLSTLFEIFGASKVAFSSRLAIEPASRGKTVTSQLFFNGYRDALMSGTEVGVCYAALHLVHLYYQLGYRPYAPTFQLPFGVRVPLVLCIRDRQYLKSVDSPLFNLLPKAADDNGQAAALIKNRFPRFENPGFDRHSRQLLWAQLAHASSDSATEHNIGLFHGLNSEELSRAMVSLTRLTFDAGESIVNRNETVSCMGVLLSGRLGIGIIHSHKPRFVSIINPGEPFGELCGLNFKSGALDIVALEKSEVVLLPQNILDKFHNLGTDIGERLTRNLLSILAHRVYAGQQAIAALLEGGDHEVRVRRNSIPTTPSANIYTPLFESYGFDSLVDKDSEYERLLLQATVVENVELSKLSHIGMKDGSTIVDVGSGPGIISLLLAKYFPNSSVIGVEPDDGLRKRAIQAAERQGRQQCTFIKGIAEQIPLDDNSVDFCYARLLFQHLPNPGAALKEMHRITARDGLIAVLDVDDAFIVTHPQIQGWIEVQQLVADTQQKNGGNRYIGRELLGLMINAGLDGIHVEAMPFTTRELGGKHFFQLVFGFKRQILERAGLLTSSFQKVFEQAETVLLNPNTFAIVVTILAHGRSIG